jgi:hypothetical protein
MNVTRRRLDTLTLYPGNPRTITREELDALVLSIRQFGMVEPLVVNPAGQIIGGNQRYQAMKQLGQTECDVVTVDLPPEQEKALVLALNKTGGTWDEDLLKQMLAGIKELDAKALGLTGFDSSELEALLHATVHSPLEQFTVRRQPGHLDKVAFGAYTAAVWGPGKSEDYARLTAWKASPGTHPEVTTAIAQDLVELIDAWARKWRGFVITVPPQGASRGSEYAAGFLGLEVAVRLGVEYVELFDSTTWAPGKRYHHPVESVRFETTPPALRFEPEQPVIIVDDMVTSGTTARRCLEALEGRPAWFFGWVNNGTRLGRKSRLSKDAV